jgi:rRNA maturation protein Nop10
MVRPQMNTRVKAADKNVKEICPECGKDVHDPDCAYNPRKGR